MQIISTQNEHAPMRRVINTWWPLAASWLLMALELPAISAVMARLPNPTISLAAYNSIVFPLALIIESPIIMLLAASTALSKDTASYRKIRSFMLVTSTALTGLHILIAFTPLYYPVVSGLLNADPAIIEPARTGMKIMLPWTGAIAFRRFNQGVLIRFERSRAVSLGTGVRLVSNWLVLAFGYLNGSLAGIIVGTSAVSVGVISEAIYIGFTTRPVIRTDLAKAKPVEPPLTLRAFLTFYIPLALTSLLTLLVNPITSAAVNRMPERMGSNAVWSAVNGLVFMLRSLGMAFNEVVVALLDEQFSSPTLRRFTTYLAIATTIALFLIAATPLAVIWLEKIIGLPPELAQLARLAIWLALPIPALNAFQSWYQGTILFSKTTRAIPESILLYLLTVAIVLIGGVIYGQIAGLYIGAIALGSSMFVQTVWLWFRSRQIRRQLQQRDEILAGQ